jgi:signal transduction histidine kinase
VIFLNPSLEWFQRKNKGQNQARHWQKKASFSAPSVISLFYRMTRRARNYLYVAMAFWTSAALAQPKEELLTQASEILSLSAEHALKGVPIRLRGIVTVAEKYWEGRFFIQDDSAGVFVDNISDQQPSVGDVVEVSGISHPGAFAPVVSKPAWKKVGTAHLPEAKSIAIERLVSGVEDGQRIEATGTVRSIREEHGLLSLELVSGGYRFYAFAQPIPGLELHSLIGARVRVRGTAAPSFNPRLRQLTTVKVFAPRIDDFIVEQKELTDPFSQPALPVGTIAQYRKDSAPGTRVRVKGVVIHQRPGEDLFLMDESGGLRIKSLDSKPFVTGRVVEAVGFPSFDRFLPVLEDAICRETAEPAITVTPKRATVAELQAGLHASLITVRAKLLDRVVQRALNRTSNAMQVKTMMILQVENLVFRAEMESLNEPAELIGVPLGSMVEATGVCLSEIDEEGKFKMLELLLPGSRQLRVLQTPSWLTAKRLSLSLATLFVVLILAISWTVIISRKNSALRVLIEEKEEAQQQLRLAQTQLEERVKKRTEQLKEQINARNESELRFESVLTERTRLAQELHDTLEQTLTGIALQMDTAGRLVEKSPEAAGQHLRLARNLVGQGQAEVRRSVWDLRSHSRQQFDLPGLLTASSRQLTKGTDIQVSVSSVGGVRPLPDLIEDNLVRIAQEALTNVIKHAGQTTAEIELNYGTDFVHLTIQDHGKGFILSECAGPLNGHFGLLGISERVKRVNGYVSISSTPGTGTTVHVEIPLQPGNQYRIPSSNEVEVLS